MSLCSNNFAPCKADCGGQFYNRIKTVTVAFGTEEAIIILNQDPDSFVVVESTERKGDYVRVILDNGKFVYTNQTVKIIL